MSVQASALQTADLPTCGEAHTDDSLMDLCTTNTRHVELHVQIEVDSCQTGGNMSDITDGLSHKNHFRLTLSTFLFLK